MLQSTYKFFSSLFFFSYYLPARCIVFLFSSFLSVPSAPVRSSYSCLFVLVFSFYFFQFQHFSLSLFVDVELWCLKLPFTVTRFLGSTQLGVSKLSLPHLVSSCLEFYPRNLFRLLAIGMCHFLPVYHLGIAFLGRVEDQNITLRRVLERWSNEVT